MCRPHRIALITGFWLVAIPTIAWAQSVSKIDFTNPNLKLTDLVDDGGNGIANLIRGLVTFLIPLAGVVAIVMIIVAGITRIVAGGNAERVKTSGDLMWEAIIGLGIALTSVLILNTINPDLTLLKSIKFEPVKKIKQQEPPSVSLTKTRIGGAHGPRGAPGAGGVGGAEPTKDGKYNITSYFPVVGDGEKSMEGGKYAKWSGPHGPDADGNFPICTLEMYRLHLNGCDYVTGASDESRKGQWFTITERTYTNAAGQTFTLRDVPLYIHDTGSAFTGRPDKIDIATDLSTSDGAAAGIAVPANPNMVLTPRSGLAGP